MKLKFYRGSQPSIPGVSQALNLDSSAMPEQLRLWDSMRWTACFALWHENELLRARNRIPEYYSLNPECSQKALVFKVLVPNTGRFGTLRWGALVALKSLEMCPGMWDSTHLLTLCSLSHEVSSFAPPCFLLWYATLPKAQTKGANQPCTETSKLLSQNKPFLFRS